ncbi:MAG: phosphatidylglycerophosphatase A [Mariprofundaceae bacterium]|nr:phosphatidylglycerophosphatase A [Mariprofundaceae bacterium]
MTTLPSTLSFNTARFIAAGFGSGWLPKAPGTWGSLASLPVAWLLVEYSGIGGLVIASLVILVLGCFVSALVLPTLESDDPGWIVIDEWAGQWLTVAIIAAFHGLSTVTLLLAFLAFRLFDIFKPFPIRQLEHMGPPWWAIMADDLLAGVMGGAVILIAMYTAGIV